MPLPLLSEPNRSLSQRLIVMTIAVLLAACGSSGSADKTVTRVGLPGGGSVPVNDPPAVSCTTKLPRSAKDYVITVNVPSDFDPAAAGVTPTTKISYSVLLPERCPGESFPVILQSHGYSGTRVRAIDANGTVEKTAHFDQINELVATLPYKGYVVISYDERGHGDSKPAKGGGYARIIDPQAEVKDAIAILDWAWENAVTGGGGAEKLPLLTEEKSTGIAKDLRLGTIGLSYGGGFQMTLAALDPRIDVMVPNGTWHNLVYSLLPGDATKNGFTALLCLLASGATDPNSTDKPAVINTPIVKTACDLLGPTNANANNIRTRAHLAAAGAAPATAVPYNNPSAQGDRTFTDQELFDLFYGHGMAYFKNAEQNGRPYPASASMPFKLRPVPALFIQGNRDVLFNLTEAYWNRKYFLEASGNAGDVRFLSTEGGHMNPLAFQSEGPVDCGGVKGLAAIYGWFDFHLKGIASAAYGSLPRVCISVASTPGQNAVPPGAAVTLGDIPVGSLNGTGAVPALLATGTASVNPMNVDPNPAFVKVLDIADDGLVLAGIPTIDMIEVKAGTPPSPVTAVAYVGVGIKRGGNTILVDQQLTSLVAGIHTHNLNLGESDNIKVLLVGIGEQLVKGDQLGLVFYCSHVQYQSVAAAPNGSSCTNNYMVNFSNAALPVFKVGTFPGSALSMP